MAKVFSVAPIGGRPMFIFYFDKRQEGSTNVGIKVSSNFAWLVEGPSTLGVEGMDHQTGAVPIPIRGEYAGQFTEIAQMTGKLHPELSNLLAGKITFRQAVDSGEIVMPTDLDGEAADSGPCE